MTKKLSLLLVTVSLIATLQAEPFTEAKVTRVVNKVSLVNESQKSRRAQLGDQVSGQTAVRTGENSRAELQFPDQTLARLGSHALFRFNSGERTMDLEGGTMLFSSPKGQGGGEVQAGAVTAAVKGTIFLLAYSAAGEVKVIVLEGKVLVFLTKIPGVRRLIRSGQMVVIPSGSTKIPKAVQIDLKRLVETSRLLESGGFGPLPDLARLEQIIKRQQSKISSGPTVPNPPFAGDAQTAQTIRNTTGANKPAPPAPVVASTPPKPKPMATPPHHKKPQDDVGYPITTGP